jgi:uncharacterized protein YrrD
MPIDNGKVGDRVLVYDDPGTIIQVEESNGYVCKMDDGRKVICEGRYMNYHPPREGPKSAKDVRLK